MKDATTPQTSDPAAAPASGFDPRAITRPDPRLMSYYTALSLLSLIFFPITFIPLLIRYRTLRYRFDDDGVGMSVGLLFRRETHLTYRRIQDIHVTRGLLQRWFGLATVEVQTASGSSAAELVIEGMLEPDRLRDWLYARMRGSHGEPETSDEPAADDDEPLALLREIRDELRRIGAQGGAQAGAQGGTQGREARS